MSAEPDGIHSKSVLTIFLRDLMGGCARHPWVTIVLVVASAIACVYYSFQVMKFKTDRSDLIDPSAKFYQRWLQYRKHFGNLDDIVVVVESTNVDSLRQAIDDIGTQLENRPEYFSNILFKVDSKSLREKGLQYLPADVLKKGIERLDDFRPVLEGQWDRISLTNTISRLHHQLAQSDEGSDQLTESLDDANIFVSSLVNTLKDRERFTNPWPELLQVPDELRQHDEDLVYLLNDAETMGFVMATAVHGKGTFEGPTEAIEALRKSLVQTQKLFPKVQMSLTGISVLENDEMRRSMGDSTIASMMSFVAVAILMFVGFRGFLHPLIGLLMLAVGMAWSFGYTSIVIGHLNILSVSFAAMLMGLGIDFAIHVLSRYLELRHNGLNLVDALIATADSVGAGIVTGAVTTSLAFFCATMTDFLGVAELGIIAGGGILLCAMAAFTILPAMIAVSDHETEIRTLPKPFQVRILRSLTLHHPWLVLMASLAVIGYSNYRMFDWSDGPPKFKVYYDHNLLNLQARGVESVETQRHIFESSKHSLLYAISMTDSFEQARELKQKFERLPSVHQVQELATRIPQPAVTGDNRLLVQAFHALLSNLPTEPPEPKPVNPAIVGEEIEQFYEFIKTRSDDRSKVLERSINSFLSELESLSLKEQLLFLGEFQYRMSYAFLAQLQSIAAVSNPDPIKIRDLPSGLRTRFVSSSGKWLLQIYPKEQIWDMEPLERFVKDLRSVDPDVTGAPLQNFEASKQIKSSYEICALYAFAMVLITLILDFAQKRNLFAIFMPAIVIAIVLFATTQALQIPIHLGAILFVFTGIVLISAIAFDARSVGDSLLALLPPTTGLGMTFGILVVLNIPLNPANLIILPLILGIGVDNGVHILHDFHAKPHHVFMTSASTINAIMLTSTTTIVGFGCMMISAHQGMHSLGAVLTIGVGACLFTSLVTLPALLTLFSWRRAIKPSNTESDLEPVLRISRPDQPIEIQPPAEIAIPTKPNENAPPIIDEPTHIA